MLLPQMSQPASVRIAVLDADTGFLQVLSKRLEGAGWQYRVLASPVPLDAIVAMRLNAVVIDLAVLGPQGWNYLEKLCTRLPGLGVIVCTGQSSVAQRVRGLRLGADDWMTKPCHPEELIARVEAVVRRRRRAEARVEAVAQVVGEVEIRADQFQAFVGGVSVDLFVRKLRQKLERSSPGWRYIHTHFGIGYRFAGEPVDGVAEEPLAVEP